MIIIPILYDTIRDAIRYIYVRSKDDETASLI